MNMKKLVSSVAAFAMTASVFAGFAVTATADDTVSFVPTGTTQIHAGDADTAKYDAAATSWTATRSQISGGLFKNSQSNYGGSYLAITQFDASSLVGKNIDTATLTFDSVCTVSGKNSSITVAVIDTNWDAATATWNSVNNSEAIGTVSAIYTTESVANTSKTLTVDVKDALVNDADKKIGFAIYTVTAREQSISNLKLNVKTTDVEMHDVTIKTAPYAAVKDSNGSVVGYTDYLGNLVIKDEAAKTETYTVVKGGYNDGTTGAVSFDKDKDAEVVLTPSENGVQFYEDFSNVGSQSLYGIQTGAGNSNVWARIQNDAAQFIGGGSGGRDMSISMTYIPDAADIYTLTYTESLYDAKPEASTSTVKVADAAGNILSTITHTSDGSEGGPITSGTINGVAMENPSISGSEIKVEVNTVEGTVTTTFNGQTSTISVENAGAPAKINVNLARNQRLTVDNIKVEGKAASTPDQPSASTQKLGEYTTQTADRPAAAWKAEITKPAAGTTYKITWNVTIDGSVYEVPHDTEITGVDTVAGLIIQEDGDNKLSSVTNVEAVIK
ncbi:MAG: DNRLRE domain-containing protein [bacterium]|nr:DNRLRE domain-containing protein [bacterium]